MPSSTKSWPSPRGGFTDLTQSPSQLLFHCDDRDCQTIGRVGEYVRYDLRVPALEKADMVSIQDILAHPEGFSPSSPRRFSSIWARKSSKLGSSFHIPANLAHVWRRSPLGGASTSTVATVTLDRSSAITAWMFCRASSSVTPWLRQP